MTTRETALTLFVAAGAMLTGLLVATASDTPARAIVVVLFLLAGPGLAWVLPLRLEDAMTTGTLAVAASLGLETVVATALLTTGRWTPGRALAMVIAITLIGLIVGLLRPPGQGSRKTVSPAGAPSASIDEGKGPSIER